MNLDRYRFNRTREQEMVLTACFCVALTLGMANLASAQQPVICNGMQVGTFQITAGGGGVTGGFTATIDTNNDGKPSLDEAAAKCDEDHFNFYQTASGTHPLIPGGGPQVDPKSGGNQPPADWADKLPWYWDEHDPPAGTPGFQDGLGREDHELDPNNDGVDEFMRFADFPGGPDGSNVNFKVWLVSLNADGSLHGYHDVGALWTWSNPVGPAGNTTAVTGSIIAGPSTSDLAPIGTGGFVSSIPAEVWDTVINENPNDPVNWGPGIWTRDGVEIGRTFPGGISQPPAPSPSSDHKTLPETPNDFHFDANFPNDGSTIHVWAHWTADINFGFEFQMFSIPGETELWADYDLDNGLLHLFNQNPEFSSLPPIYEGPIELFDPGSEPFFGQYLPDFRNMMAMGLVPEPSSFVLCLLGVAMFVMRRRR